jgi:nucleotide-binding universal stress UspA family protein
MISTIAVGADGSETASKAVDITVDMARRFGARVVLMSVYGDRPGAGSSGKFDEGEFSWNPQPRFGKSWQAPSRDSSSTRASTA